MRSLPDILPSVKFLNFGNIFLFSCFFLFILEKTRGDFWKRLLDKNGPTCISAMPRLILRYSIWIFIDPKMYPHTYIRSMMFFLHFLGHVLIGREQRHHWRRLSAPGATYTSPATCFSTRPVGDYCWKNRKYYSILTHHGMPGWAVQR